jgi:hypothetical protein
MRIATLCFRFPVSLICFLALLSTSQLAAQDTKSAILTGTVLGPDDRPVPHASVSYQSSSGTAPHVVYSDSKGRFTIAKLKADNYDLRASGKGVFSVWEKNIRLRAGETKTMTLRLIYAKQIPKAYVKKKPQN